MGNEIEDRKLSWILTISVVSFADKTLRAIDLSWVQPHISKHWSSSLTLCKQVFNSAWPALCWVSLEDCKEHCSRGSLLSCQCQVYEQSPVPCLNLQSGVCDSLQVPGVLQKPDGADARALWELPALWLSLWPSGVCSGLQSLLWPVLTMGRSLCSFGLEHSKPRRRKKLCLGRREGKHLDWHLLLLCPNQLEHQGWDYPTCWASISFLPFINKVSLQTSFVVFWASPEDSVLFPSTWIPSTQYVENRD